MGRKNKRTGSIVAGVLFGLAAGIAVGNYVLAPSLPHSKNTINNSIVVELADAKQQVKNIEAEAKAADSVVDSVAEATSADKLTDKPVLLMRTEDAADEDVKIVDWLLKKAGVKQSGTIVLRDKFFSQQGADSVKTLAVNTLPAGAQLSADRLDSGTHSGETFGAALLMKNNQPQADDAERQLLLDAFTESDFISVEGDIQPAVAVVLVIGNSDGKGNSSFAATNQAAFAQALKSKGDAVVVAGQLGSAEDTGAIGQLRKSNLVSTVDSVNYAYGRVATVLAVRDQLEGKAGAYGAAPNASSAVPE